MIQISVFSYGIAERTGICSRADCMLHDYFSNMFSISRIMCRGGAGSLPGLYERQLKRRPRENDTKSDYRACAKIQPSCLMLFYYRNREEKRKADARAYELLNCSFYSYKDNTKIWDTLELNAYVNLGNRAIVAIFTFKFTLENYNVN